MKSGTCSFDGRHIFSCRSPSTEVITILEVNIEATSGATVCPSLCSPVSPIQAASIAPT